MPGISLRKNRCVVLITRGTPIPGKMPEGVDYVIPQQRLQQELPRVISLLHEQMDAQVLGRHARLQTKEPPKFLHYNPRQLRLVGFLQQPMTGALDGDQIGPGGNQLYRRAELLN